MGIKNHMFVILLLFAETTPIISGAQSHDQWENDMTAAVSKVIDGDTFHTTSGDSVRLADINAPEAGQAGADKATNALVSLVGNRTVYLDIDDISRIDSYGRLVCVVYVDHNSTHVQNVNKTLLVEGVAEIWDHTNNEFNPYTWTLYNQKTETPEDSTPPVPVEAVIAILLLGAALTVILFKRKTEK